MSLNQNLQKGNKNASWYIFSLLGGSNMHRSAASQLLFVGRADHIARACQSRRKEAQPQVDQSISTWPRTRKVLPAEWKKVRSTMFTPSFI